MIDKETREVLNDGVYPIEVANAIDDLGYKFLREQGFKRTAKARTSESARANIVKQLEARGVNLGVKQDAGDDLVVFFYLEDKTTHEVIAKSEGVRFNVGRGSEN